MGIFSTIKDKVGRSSQPPAYECRRCGETYDEPKTTCSECGGAQIRAIS